MVQFDLQTKKITLSPVARGCWDHAGRPDGRYISTFSADTRKAMLAGIEHGEMVRLGNGNRFAVSQLVSRQQIRIFRRLGSGWALRSTGYRW